MGQVNGKDIECPPNMDYGSRVQNTAVALRPDPKVYIGPVVYCPAIG